MKIKSFSLSLFVLASLIILSFAFYVGAENSFTGTKSVFLDSDQDGLSDEEEKIYGTNPANSDTDSDGYSDGAEVRSGYDPLKKAPGDKLPGFTGSQTTNSTAPDSNDSTSTVLGDSSENNLTTNIAQRITELTEKSTLDNDPVTLDELQTLVDESMAPSTISQDDLPQVSEKDLQIKEQNYDNLSAEKAAAQRKEDFLDYIIAVSYIFSSNSAKPITTISDIPTMASDIMTTITTAVTTQNTADLQDLAISQRKIAEQLKDVPVPEDVVDTHIKALRFMLYAEQLTGLIEPKVDDPIGSIANLTKLQGFMTAFSDFITEAQSKISQYGIAYDQTVKEKLESFGIEAPKDSAELQSLLEITTGATTNTTSTP
jgi:hypothetical protein